jgi:Kef-type K+ transport system membrane component KefB
VIDALAEIGIVFLMFVVGVQLSLRELLKAGRMALLGGILQVSATIGLGYGLVALRGVGRPRGPVLRRRNLELVEHGVDEDPQ